MSGRDDFGRALAALIEGAPPAGHPDDARLTAYVAGELGADEDEAVQRHLALCRRCARLVAEASRFPDLEPVPGEPDGAGTRSAWAATRARLVEEGVLPATAAAPERSAAPEPVAGPLPFSRSPRAQRDPRRRELLGRPGVAWAVAATLALAVVGLGAWNARLAGRLAQPVGNVPIVDLSLTVTRSSGGAPVEVPVDAAPVVVLLLAPERLPEYSAYGVELVGAAGEPLWSVSGLRPTEFETFTLQVPSRRIPAGTSRLRLLGLVDEGLADGELLEEHELRKAG
ncbi:MAG TPA: zf-HC2 domain-containing protein [Thermoanaerobaculia bacterium]|nr:zf-HC2 domain-containing protein [Thermoanaerobaculia bacterium]